MFDFNGNQKWHYDEFKAAFQAHDKKASDEWIKYNFNLADTNKDGVIDLIEAMAMRYWLNSDAVRGF
jgi:Ca2+-binding EF-hand superfamily protein